MIFFIHSVSIDGNRKRKVQRSMDENNELLTVLEAADYLKVPVSWIYERTRTRAIPVRKIGRHCRIPKVELLAWIDEQDQMQIANEFNR